jgi:sugar lactone lactonase YvrE
MSKVPEHRHVTFAKLAKLGVVAMICCDVAGCSARATGTEDIVAIAHDGPESVRGKRSTSNSSQAVVDGSGDPFLEPSDTTGQGSAGSAAVRSNATDGSDASKTGAAETPKDPQAPDSALGDPTLGGARDVPRQTVLFWVDAVSSRLWRANAEGDGSDRRLLANALSTVSAPDGITVDLTNSFIYWTNMGTPVGGAGVGSLQRMKLDDDVVQTVIPVGTTSTPKQINIDNQARKLYWSDREAMVWRSELDGSSPEIILSGHELMQPVGMGLDVARRQVYISDRQARKLFRVGFDMPEGEKAATRSDVETLADFPDTRSLAWPLNIALDLDRRQMYWTDRTRGVIYRMNMDMPAGADPVARPDLAVVVAGLTEPVGLAFDSMGQKLYFTELSGRVSRCNLDGSQQAVILTTASASGIALAHLPE